MRVGGFELRTRLWPTLATLVLFPILVGLGLWQLDRAAQKRAAQEAVDRGAEQAPLQITGLLSDIQGLERRRVTLDGHYDPERTWLLDNRTHQGRPGYHVFTPFRIAGSEVWVLVNRGWVPMGLDRRVLPDIDTPAQRLTLAGTLKPPPEAFLVGPVEPPLGRGVEVVQLIDPARFAQATGRTVQPFVVRLDADQPHGYVREWLEPGFGASRHRAYAVQWFGLAVALLLLFLAANTRRARTEDE
jgi:surfeit locus 1 family protein